MVLTALVLSLSGVRLGQASERLAVVFLVDASDSVGQDGRNTAEQVVNAAIAQMPDGDRAAVVLFGDDAMVERAMSDSRSARTVPLPTGRFRDRYRRSGSPGTRPLPR